MKNLLLCLSLAATATMPAFSTEFLVNGALTTATTANGAPPSWSTNTPSDVISSLVQPIFNWTSPYLQVQASSTGTIFQNFTLGSSGDYLFTLQASFRNDNSNAIGVLAMSLYSGSGTGGAVISPSASTTPALTTSIQNYSKSYTGLAAGTYTVEVGGVRTGGSFFQMGVDNVSFTDVAAPTPEPSTLALAAAATAALFLRRKTNSL